MSVRTLDKKEVLVVGVIIEVPHNTVLPERYKGIFRGKTDVQRGKYTYWYPVKNTSYSRMINELKNRYGFGLRYGVAGTMEV